MTLSDWINNIRWKYFTNNKAGLIFKELMKEFRTVEQMTENKRYFKREWEEEYYIDKLNNQEQLIKELKQENRQLKITYAKCRDCQHANMYTPEFAFQVIDPKCGLNVKAITSESNACEDFELIGRCSR